MNLKEFMGLGFKPVYLAAIMVSDNLFRAVTINSLFSAEIMPRREEVGLVIANKSRFLNCLIDRGLFSIGLLDALSEQEARFFSTNQRADLDVGDQPNWTEMKGVPVFSMATASVVLELNDIISRNENSLVLTRVVEFIGGIEGGPLHYGRADLETSATYRSFD